MGLADTYVLHLLPLFLSAEEVEIVWDKVRQGFSLRQALQTEVKFLLDCSLEELEVISSNLDESSRQLLTEAIDTVSLGFVKRLDKQV